MKSLFLFTLVSTLLTTACLESRPVRRPSKAYKNSLSSKVSSTGKKDGKPTTPNSSNTTDKIPGQTEVLPKGEDQDRFGIPLNATQYHYVSEEDSGYCIEVKIAEGVTDADLLKGIYKGSCPREVKFKESLAFTVQVCDYVVVKKDKRWDSAILYGRGIETVNGATKDYERDYTKADMECKDWIKSAPAQT